MNADSTKEDFFSFRLYPESLLSVAGSNSNFRSWKKRNVERPLSKKQAAMKAASDQQQWSNSWPTKAGEWEIKHTVLLFVGCLHNPYSLSSRSVDEKLPLTLHGKPVLLFEAWHRCSTFTEHDKWNTWQENLQSKCPSPGGLKAGAVGYRAPSYYASLITAAQVQDNKWTGVLNNERPVAPQTEIFCWETKAAGCKAESSASHSFLALFPSQPVRMQNSVSPKCQWGR